MLSQPAAAAPPTLNHCCDPLRLEAVGDQSKNVKGSKQAWYQAGVHRVPTKDIWRDPRDLCRSEGAAEERGVRACARGAVPGAETWEGDMRKERERVAGVSE